MKTCVTRQQFRNVRSRKPFIYYQSMNYYLLNRINKKVIRFTTQQQESGGEQPESTTDCGSGFNPTMSFKR